MTHPDNGKSVLSHELRSLKNHHSPQNYISQERHYWPRASAFSGKNPYLKIWTRLALRLGSGPKRAAPSANPGKIRLYGRKPDSN